MIDVISDFLFFYTHTGVTVGILCVIIIGLFLSFLFKKFKNNSFVLLFELFFEKIYEFFEEILGKEEKRWIKVYITLLFFIILFSNLFGVFLDLLKPIFGEEMSKIISIPTGDINFNIAMAVIGLFIIIIEQFKALGFFKTIYEYIPIFGKDYIPYTKGILPKIIDYPLFLIVKFFDVIISIFLGFLDIVGHLAKIVSLSFRLFGNITSGGILLAMLISGLIGLTNNVIGISFPVVGPVILYLQGILVSLIQALVFPLLIAIFIKVAKVVN